MGAIFLKNGVYLSDEELAFVFGKIDADGGGDVDVDEFMSWLRGSSHLAAKLRNKMSVDGEANESDEDDAVRGFPLFSVIFNRKMPFFRAF